jgi:2,3-bisphosphoglycerate-independent phosphoglycerate mutase
MVATYDRASGMSAEAVTDIATAAIKKRIYSLVVINYANPDMVGHTGQIPATIQHWKRWIDVWKIAESISKVGGTAIVTADHGNAETMIDDEGNPGRLILPTPYL